MGSKNRHGHFELHSSKLIILPTEKKSCGLCHSKLFVKVSIQPKFHWQSDQSINQKFSRLILENNKTLGNLKNSVYQAAFCNLCMPREKVPQKYCKIVKSIHTNIILTNVWKLHVHISKIWLFIDRWIKITLTIVFVFSWKQIFIGNVPKGHSYSKQ